MKKYIVLILLMVLFSMNIHAEMSLRDKSPLYKSGGIERYSDNCKVLSSILLQNDTILVLQKKKYGKSAEETFTSRYVVKNGEMKAIADKNRYQYIGRSKSVDCAQLIRFRGAIYAVIFSMQGDYGMLDITKYDSAKGWTKIDGLGTYNYRSGFVSAVEYNDILYIFLDTLESDNLLFTTFNGNELNRDVKTSIIPTASGRTQCMQTCNVGKMRRLLFASIAKGNNISGDLYISPDLDDPSVEFDFQLRNNNNYISAGWGQSALNVQHEMYNINGISMIQGSVAGITPNSVETPPMQLFFSSSDRRVTGEVFNVEIPLTKSKALSNKPNTNYITISESQVRYTDLPYGGIAACSVLSPKVSPSPSKYDLYKQNIVLIRADYNWYNSKMHWCTIESNSIRTKKEDYQSTLDDPACRDIIQLVGVIEGPPPCAVHPNYWKDAGGCSTEFTFLESKGQTFTTTRTIDFDIMIGSASKFATFKTEYEVMAGYALSNTAGSSKSITETYTLSAKATSKDMFIGTALYSLPIITTFSGAIWSPDNTVEYETSLPPVTKMTGLGHAVRHFKLSEAPFSIEEPEYLENWAGNRFLGEKGNMITGSPTMNITPYVSQTWELKISDGTESSMSHSLKESFRLVLPFYKLDQKFSTKWTDKTTTTMTNAFTAKFAAGNNRAWKTKDESMYISSYLCEMVGLKYEKDNNAYDYYADKMTALKIGENKDFRLMVENEKPFIIGWRVQNIKKSLTPGATSTENGNATESGTENINNDNEIISKAYIDGDNIVVTAQPTSLVMIYNTQGVLIKEFEMQSSLMESDLINGGLYIINIKSPDGNIKTIKIVK